MDKKLTDGQQDEQPREGIQDKPSKGTRFMHALNTAVNLLVLVRVAWALVGEVLCSTWRWLRGE